MCKIKMNSIKQEWHISVLFKLNGPSLFTNKALCTSIWFKNFLFITYSLYWKKNVLKTTNYAQRSQAYVFVKNVITCSCVNYTLHRFCKCIFIPTINKTIFSCSFTLIWVKVKITVREQGRSKKDNPEKLATQVTQNEVKKKTTATTTQYVLDTKVE